jgi:hypothetical protein
MMFQALRKHISPASILALAALVFAVTGGAFAATGGGRGGSSRATLTASGAKAKAKAGPRGPAGAKGTTGATGPAGPAGPTGPVGPAGPQGGPGGQGAQGETGKEGPAGALGTSVTSKTIASGGSECAGAGGVKLTPGGNVCNGKEGPPGPLLETLPAGKTLRGVFAADSYAEAGFSLPTPPPNVGKVIAAATFVFPFSHEPAHHYIPVGQGEGEGNEAPAIVSHECTGTVTKPGAAEGNLCVFAEREENLFSGGVTVSIRGNPEATYGFEVGDLSANKGAMELVGTWAVTG